jgi:hypothetical protein
MDKKEKLTDDELLQELVDKVEMGYRFLSEPIQRARNYNTFLYIDQWDAQTRILRENASKPVLTFNKLVPILRSIVGEQRKNTPAIDVSDASIEINAPQQLIDFYNDYCRELTYKCNFDVILQNVFRQFLECGWGAARVTIDYESTNSFQKVIKIEPIVDIQAAFWDPAAQEPDKSDGDFCGVHQIMSKEGFKREYPDIEAPISASNSNYYMPWNDGESIVVAELYVKEYFAKTIYQLSDGSVLEEKDAKEKINQQAQYLEENPEAVFMNGIQPLEILDKRKVRDYKIMYYKFIQNHLLKKSEWPGKTLPIPYGEGDSTIIDGQRIPLPFMAETVDAQKLYNYVMSETAYAILRSRKETFMATEGNIEGNEDVWSDPDNVQGTLTWKPDAQAPGAKPEVIRPGAFSPELINMAQYVSGDLQDLTGRKEEALGRETNAQSGIAIAKRQEASSLPVNVYQDNLARFARNLFKIVLDVLPNVMDEPDRKVMVRSADGKRRVVQINQRKGLSYDMQTGQYKDDIANDVSKAQLDVQVRVDGSYDAQKAAAFDFLIRLSAINPQISNLVADLMAENSGLENAQKLIKRLETLLPPQILAQEQGKPPPPPPQPPPDPKIVAAQMKMQTDTQANQLKEQELMQKQQELIINAKLKGLDYQAAWNKALAEIQKSQNAVKEAALTHASTVHSSNSDLSQKIIDAQSKHVALGAQAQALKGTQL